MNRIDLYKKTVKKWGEEAQYDQAIEECAELITALQHLKRKKNDRQAVINELADVTLMLGQLTWMFGENQVQQAIGSKLKKLSILLEEE